MTGRDDAPRSILITGAASGIGQALAQAYARPGVALALSDRDGARLEDSARACRERGAGVRADVVDVADRAAMTRWIAAVDSATPLDLVIANAGIAGGSGGGGEREEQVRDIFAVNMVGVLNTILPVVPAMQARGRGQIAVMSSMAGLLSLPSLPAYSASKNAVRAYGEALRGVLADDGIGVSVILPGWVESRMTDGISFPTPFLMDADKAAWIIRRGLARNKARIAFPWPMVAKVSLLNLLPYAIRAALLRRALKKI